MSDHQEKFLLEQAAKPGLDIYDYIVILIQLSNYAARVAALAAAFWGYCLSDKPPDQVAQFVSLCLAYSVPTGYASRKKSGEN